MILRRNLEQKMQVLGCTVIDSRSSIWNGEADKKRIYSRERSFSTLRGKRQNRELFIRKRKAKYEVNTAYNFHG